MVWGVWELFLSLFLFLTYSEMVKELSLCWLFRSGHCFSFWYSYAGWIFSSEVCFEFPPWFLCALSRLCRQGVFFRFVFPDQNMLSLLVSSTHTMVQVLAYVLCWPCGLLRWTSWIWRKDLCHMDVVDFLHFIYDDIRHGQRWNFMLFIVLTWF